MIKVMMMMNELMNRLYLMRVARDSFTTDNPVALLTYYKIHEYKYEYTEEIK
jgi:hypothetical protein